MNVSSCVITFGAFFENPIYYSPINLYFYACNICCYSNRSCWKYYHQDNIVIKTRMLAEKQYYQTESGHESYMHYYLRNILRRFGFQSHSFNLCGELIFNSMFILLLNITITTTRSYSGMMQLHDSTQILIWF